MNTFLLQIFISFGLQQCFVSCRLVGWFPGQHIYYLSRDFGLKPERALTLLFTVTPGGRVRPTLCNIVSMINHPGTSKDPHPVSSRTINTQGGTGQDVATHKRNCEKHTAEWSKNNKIKREAIQCALDFTRHDKLHDGWKQNCMHWCVWSILIIIYSFGL